MSDHRYPHWLLRAWCFAFGHVTVHDLARGIICVRCGAVLGRPRRVRMRE